MPRPSSSAAASAGRLRPPRALPTLDVETDWKGRSRTWGHPFHPMCSYLASHPAALSHALVARWSRPGDVVLDPFSGRGTTPLQACSEGRLGVGNDLNPLAWVLTAAKVEAPSRAAIATRLSTLRLAFLREAADWARLVEAIHRHPDARVVPRRGTRSETPPRARLAASPADGGPRRPVEAPPFDEALPEEVLVAFHPDTLAQLLAVRSALDLDDPLDRFVSAALAGILHGRTAGYLSTLMPNTFSMAPRYVRTYAARTGYQAPPRHVFDALERKVERLFRAATPLAPGLALSGDARDLGERLPEALRSRGLPDRVRLVVTSPPYLRVVRYGYYNWLRMWLLGFDPRSAERRLDDGHGPVAYIDFMAEVLAGLRPALAGDAVLALVIGDVEMDRGHASDRGRDLAARVWEQAAAPAGYLLAGVVADDVVASRKMTRLWGREAGRATQTDHILVLGATETGRRRAIAGAGTPVDWTWPPRAIRLA